MTSPPPPAPAGGLAPVPVRTVVVLGLLSTFGPLSLDLYLPALPSLATDLATTTSSAQLSITACLIGLATGQLVAGPMSDRYGRRRPLVIGLALYLLSSAACAVAPSIEVLLALRLLQGLAGSAGIVIARAVARDLFSGRVLLVVFARLMLVSGMAPIAAPVLGGQLSRVMSWRGIFWCLAAVGVALLACGLFGLPESHPASRRTTGGLAATLHGFRRLLRDRPFVAVVTSSGLAAASLFAYIAGATFVLQRIYGLSATGFSLVFGSNAVGILLLSQLGAMLARRGWPALRVMAIGIVINLVGALTLCVVVVAHLSLSAILTALFVMVAALGFVFPTATTLAMSDHPDQAGAASSLLGMGQFVLGGVVAPLVGLRGEESAVPLGVVALACSLLGAVLFFAVARPAMRGHRPE
ncbi:MAG: multidrug effflux MFS transporter [Lapillicoccus sp.]